MASSLTQFQMLKSVSDRLIIAIEDVSDLWPIIREGFESHVPFRRAVLNNKARNPVTVERLPVEFILTTDARLRGRSPIEQSPFWFRHPYATVVLVTCEDLDEYKSLLKPRLKSIVQNEDREWFIVYVTKASANESAAKLAKRVFSRLDVDFSSKKRERCCRLEIHGADSVVWEDVESKLVECIRNTLDRRVQFYEEEVRRLSENRFTPGWNFCNFFVVKESLAVMFEMAHLHEDAIREYDELEQIYLEIVNTPSMKSREFGGLDVGDERAAILDISRKPFSQFALEDSVREFDFRQYIFARQALLLFSVNRPAEVAARAFPFIISFSRCLLQQERKTPFCLREVWVITACMAVVKATSERFSPRLVGADVEKDFYRLQADLYSYARTKLMRLADLIGYGSMIEKSPCNSAALSMLPWPKPAIWPPVPLDAAGRISAKQQAILERSETMGAGLRRKELPLAPGMLLREANRRRASLSAGNISEMLDSNRYSFKESPAADGVGAVSSPPRSVSSSPGSVSSGVHVRPGSPSMARIPIDRPMKLPEIQAAAEYALLTKNTDDGLQKALSSVEGFEELYLEMTRAAADNYHRSWRKRHGVVLDGEVAAVYYRRGNLDSAVKLYEKVCALYSGERWHALLAGVLPRLSECQKQLGDWAGYLSSCIKLLTLDKALLLDQERQSLQSEIVTLAHSGLKVPVSLDVSALITFTSREGPPLELFEGDPGTLQVTVWSGFPDDIYLESLSLTLITTFSADEGAKMVKSADAPILRPGKNILSILLPPQRSGSYVLGVLTGHIGDVKLRSHTSCYTSAASCKGGPPDSDDYLSYEKPLRPVLEVTKPRALVEIKAAVSWRLLVGEPQWVGLVINPFDYSLKGAYLHISAGPGLELDDSQRIQFELFDTANAKTVSELESTLAKTTSAADVCANLQGRDLCTINNGLAVDSCSREIHLVNTKARQVELPEWANLVCSVIWLRVVAKREHENAGTQLLYSPSTSPPRGGLNRTISIGTTVKDIGTEGDKSKVLENGSNGSYTMELEGSNGGGMRTLSVKLEFGAGRSRTYERDIGIQFTEPFHIGTRVAGKGSDRTLLLQVTLTSELVARITILDARLELQAGFVHVNNTEGRPSLAWLLPLVLSATSEGALLFVVRSVEVHAKDGSPAANNDPDKKESILTVKYQISGSRRVGAHSPARENAISSNEESSVLLYSSAFTLQMPVLEQLVAVGMLPIPTAGPRVGHQVVFQWRVERLKEGCANSAENLTDTWSKTSRPPPHDGAQVEVEELQYELVANIENWMIAGRKKGRISLSTKLGSRVVVSMACVPLVAGHVHPPLLSLANISGAHISNSPAGPHIVCILPPAPCSTLCVSKNI